MVARWTWFRTVTRAVAPRFPVCTADRWAGPGPCCLRSRSTANCLLPGLILAGTGLGITSTGLASAALSAVEPARAGSAVSRSGRAVRRVGAGWPVWIAVTAVCVLWLIPTAGTVITSFRTSPAANSSGWWRALATPFDTDQFTLSNYRFAWTGGMASAYLNSIAVTLPAVALPVLLAAFAAYALIFMRMPGAGVWYVLIVSLLIVPTLIALAPLLRLESEVGIAGRTPRAGQAMSCRPSFRVRGRRPPS